MKIIHFIASVAMALTLPLLAARGEPRTLARFLIFEVGPDDEISLVETRDVDIAGELETEDLSRSASDRDGPKPALRGSDQAVITLVGEHGPLFRKTISIERAVHVEFVTESGEMARQTGRSEKTAFSALIPRGGHTVEIFRRKASALKSFHIEPSYATADSSVGFAIATSTGSPANRVDILVLGDGYTAAEASKFKSDTAWAVSFTGMSPFDDYESFLNVVTHFVPSAESGADHPSCPDDSDSDPNEGTYRNTAFDATYCSFDLQRLLTVNRTKVLSVAGAVFPDFDFVVVLVNDTFYGGSGSGRGGRISVSSVNLQAARALKHEWGHTFTDLADEYTSPYPGFPDCNDASDEPCEANVTTQTDRSLIKWNSLILGSTPIPTYPPDDYPSRVGLFEGARYHETGYYRPKLDCFMRRIDEGVSFCEVCRQEYVLTLYRGWGGIPARGIELIEPGSETPTAATVVGHVGSASTFRATVLQGNRGPRVSIRWEVDGQVQPSRTSTMTFTPTVGGSYSIRMIVTDPTRFVDKSVAGEDLTSVRTWTLIVGETRRRLVWR